MLLQSAVFSQQNCSYKITGHVTDADLGSELNNAVVTIKELKTTVTINSYDNFAFTGICPGTYTLLVTHVDCEPYQRSVTVTNRNIHIDITMPHAKNTLIEEVIVTATERKNTGINKTLNGQELQKTSGENLAEAMTRLTGVTMMQTGTTIAKPVVHGLFGSRLLLINNGVRQEGQQWGNEHAPEVDPFIANSISVMKGVDQLKYGSDAIAGVVLIEPKPLRSTPGKNFDANLGFFSNNKMFYANAVYEQMLSQVPAWSYRTHFTYKRGANAATPNYRLNNTGMEELSYSLSLKNTGATRITDIFASGFHTALGIFKGSHIGNTTDLKTAIAASRPADVFLNQQTYKIERPKQEVSHYIAKLKSSWNLGPNRINTQIAYQNNTRKEYDIVRNSANTVPQLELNVETISEDLSWEHRSKKLLHTTIGVSGIQQFNNYSGRYFIPNYFSNTIGAYALEKIRWNHWEFQAGFRGDIKHISTERLKFNGDTINHTFKYNSIAGSFNTIYYFNTHLKTNLNLSLSMRAPYVNELLSDGIHHGTATYEKGNILLSSEQSFFTAWNINYNSRNEKLRIDFLLHRNQIKNFIYQQPRPDQPELTIAGAFPKIEWMQTNALLYGLDMTGELNILRNLLYRFKISVLYAKNKKTDDWLTGMPADRWGNELAWNFKPGKKLTNSFAGIEMLAVAQQNRVPANYEQYDFKEAPGGYVLWNLNAGTTIHLNKMPVECLLQIKNVTNTVYRDYQNTFRYFSDESGRNISLKLKIPIL